MFTCKWFKRSGALFLTLCLLIAAVPFSAAYAKILSPVSADAAWDILKKANVLEAMSMGSQKYLDKLKKVMSEGDTKLGKRTFSSGQQCSGFAAAALKALLGKALSPQKGAYPKLRGATSLTASMLRESGISQRGPFLIRTVATWDKTCFDKYKDGKNGHSIVVLYYDDNYIYSIEGNQEGDNKVKGSNVFFRRSFEEFDRNQLTAPGNQGRRVGDPRKINYVVAISDAEFKRMYDDAEELVEINSTNFPDENFRKYVKTFDKDKNEKLGKSELSSVKKMEYDRGKEKKKDISNLKGIEFFTELTELTLKNISVKNVDLSKNLKLENVTLSCKLESLDVSKNTKLKTLRCDGNNISKLALGKQDQLRILFVVNNNKKLKKIDISGCKILCGLIKTYAKTEGPKYTLWGESSADKDKILVDSNINVVAGSGDAEGETVGEVAINKEHFPDSVFREYVKRFDKDKNGVLSQEERNAVKKIQPKGNNLVGCKDMTGIEYFTELKWLFCEYWLEKIDLRKNTKLTHLDIENAKMKRLDVSKNTKLVFLDCMDSDFSEVILGKQDNLMFLRCRTTRNLKELDISRCKKLCKLVKEGKRLSFGWFFPDEDNYEFIVDTTIKIITDEKSFYLKWQP